MSYCLNVYHMYCMAIKLFSCHVIFIVNYLVDYFCIVFPFWSDDIPNVPTENMLELVEIMNWHETAHRHKYGLLTINRWSWFLNVTNTDKAGLCWYVLKRLHYEEKVTENGVCICNYIYGLWESVITYPCIHANSIVDKPAFEFNAWVTDSIIILISMAVIDYLLCHQRFEILQNYKIYLTNDNTLYTTYDEKQKSATKQLQRCVH